MRDAHRASGDSRVGVSMVRILAVGGTDPLSGAGIVADALTIAECGGHPLTVPTAIVDQDSTAVRSFEPVSSASFERSLVAALTDGRPDAVKVGMLASGAQAGILSDLLAVHLPRSRPVVVDPVMRGGVGSTAADLAEAGAYAALLDLDARFEVVFTPNAVELAELLGEAAASDRDGLQAQALEFHRRTGVSLVAKGGHVEPPGEDFAIFHGAARRLAPTAGVTADVHGTGCRLASALATGLGQGMSPWQAVDRAREYLADSFRRRVAAIGVGRAQFVPIGAVLRGEVGSDT